MGISVQSHRIALLGLFGGKVLLRPADTKPGERPNLIARVGMNRGVLLEARSECCWLCRKW